MEERRRPAVMPREDVWIRCEKWAEKYGLEPLQVLKELVRIGEDAIDSGENESGGSKVVNLLGGKKVKISSLPQSKS
jgi:hypothetical protein